MKPSREGQPSPLQAVPPPVPWTEAREESRLRGGRPTAGKKRSEPRLVTLPKICETILLPSRVPPNALECLRVCQVAELYRPRRQCHDADLLLS